MTVQPPGIGDSRDFKFSLLLLAFADHSYEIDIGSDHKVPLITIGWYRWHPDSIEFPRWGLGPWPRDERDET
jgi:hypothetical protein